MTAIRTWYYTELPKDIYIASIREHYPGSYIFRAQPNRGSYCIECISTDLEELTSKAEMFAAGTPGRDIEGFYTAAY